jgi:hypothetical protein
MEGDTAVFANAKGCCRAEAEAEAPPDLREETGQPVAGDSQTLRRRRERQAGLSSVPAAALG